MFETNTIRYYYFEVSTVHFLYIYFNDKRLWMFENSVLGKIFGPMREEVAKGRRLNNEELHNFTKYY
jgi:hypothetical protein